MAHNTMLKVERNGKTMPNWVKPERQAVLVDLFVQSSGFCVLTHKPCQGTWEKKEAVLCAWGNRCSEPVPNGEPCWHEPEQGKPHLPCNVIHVNSLHWHCAYGDYPCYKPHECHYELYTDRLVKDWVQSDRQVKIAEWQAERKQLHSMGERRTPVRGRFNIISQDIYYPRQPSYYLEALGISGLTFKPFAKIRIANTYTHLFVDLGNALKPVSKNHRRKAIRYGKPLPKDITGIIDEHCNRAVRHYLNR